MKNVTVYSKWDNNTYYLTIEPNKSIQIDCTYNNAHNPRPTSRTFKIGDQAEYDSYNLSYTGTIIGISEKTVSIKPEHRETVKRLKLTDFCWRNWDFDEEKTAHRNSEEMMCI